MKIFSLACASGRRGGSRDKRKRRKMFQERSPYHIVRLKQKQTASRNPFRTSLPAAALTSWFGLLWGLRLSSCSAIAVKQDAVGSQIGDQRVQIIR